MMTGGSDGEQGAETDEPRSQKTQAEEKGRRQIGK
jgi:hypothetical protein